jgi:hypothetical protein
VYVVPRISKFAGLTIVLYYNDHDPPHFHVIGENQTRIGIETGAYLKGDNPLPSSKEKDVLKWLEMWRNDIMKGWNDCREGKEPAKIPPLY